MNNAKSLAAIDWLEYQQLGESERAKCFQQDGNPSHLLMSQQFDRSFLDRVCDLATRTRSIAKTRGGMIWLQDLMAEKRAMLYFVQPSTRTFLSFLAACEILGIKPGEVRDTSTSSELKGESQEDTVRTISSYFDVIIMRHPTGGFAERIAWMLAHSDRPIPVINAGSGSDQHPTQALLDVYTLQRSFETRGGIEGKRIAFVGDLARGRTVRSLAYLMRYYPRVHLHFIAPEGLQIGQDILDSLNASAVAYTLGNDLSGILSEIDGLYMTRIQDEWDTAGESSSVDVLDYAITPERLLVMKEDAVIMHPLPRRGEISPAVDADPRAMYWRQVRNGMWVRVALLLMVFERDREVDRYFNDLTR